MKSRLVRAMCFLLCFLFILTSIQAITAPYNLYADEYKLNDSDDEDEYDRDGADYFIVEGKDVDKLFDFGLSDIKDVWEWIWSFKTFTVIKRIDEDGDGDKTYTFYFNTPNLQSLVKNSVLNGVSDGYTEHTYDVNESQWIVNVGNSAEHENVITKYGFQIPSYTYMGEYPAEVMSAAGVVPSHWYDWIWRAIKSLFGASFLEAPDADNFNTITYLNHGYLDKEDYLVEFFQNYYIKWWCARIATGQNFSAEREGYDHIHIKSKDGLRYFSDPEALIRDTITEAQAKAAEGYILDNFEKYVIAKRISYGYKAYADEAITMDSALFSDETISSEMNGFHEMDDADDTELEETIFGISKKYDEMEEKFNVPSRYHILPLDPVPLKVELKDGQTIEDVFPHHNVRTFIENNIDYLAAVREWWMNDPNSTKLERGALLYSIYINELSRGENSYGLPTEWGTDGSAFIAAVDDLMNKDTVSAVLLFFRRIPKRSRLADFYQVNGKIDEPLPAYIGPDGQTVQPTAAPTPSPTPTPSVSPTPTPATSGTPTPTPTPVPADPADKKMDSFDSTNRFYFVSTDGKVIDTSTIDFRKALKSLLTSRITVDSYDFQEKDFISAGEKALINAFESSYDTIDDYYYFLDCLELGLDPASPVKVKPKKGMTAISYSQCLIPNTGEKGECKNDEFGEETEISVSSLYAYAGLYKLTPEFNIKDFYNHNASDTDPKLYWNKYPDVYASKTELTEEAAHRIINFIKTNTGPYFTDVISNMIKIMVRIAYTEGSSKPLRSMGRDDIRIMPYDTDTMIPADAENYSVTDPRVDLYKETILGALVSDFTIYPAGILIYFKPQTTILNATGRITEFSVFMQQLCNFNVLDDYGLSPAKMWDQENGLSLLIIGFLVLFFIFKTVVAVAKLVKDSGSSDARIFLGFLFLFLELAFIVSVAANPERAWTVIKNADTKIMNIGEMSTVYSNENLRYLYGDASDMEVTYYMPYLDAWSKYNTGYGILADQQHIDFDKDENLPELREIAYPQVGSNPVEHYSVILADAFSYYGYSNSAYNSILIDNGDGTYKNVNGPSLNNNAYRVVDHFMAPRVDVTDKGDTIKLKTHQNENYNGEFQSGIVDLIVKLMLSVFICFLSMIKLLTFFWQWYMFYILFFNVILGKAEGKSWGLILLTTFAPTIACIFIGVFSGVAILIGMQLSGLIGLVIILAFFILSFNLIRWWHNVEHGLFFPRTLNWLYAITNMRDVKRRKDSEEFSRINKGWVEELNDPDFMGWENMSLEEKRNILFDESGVMKHKYAADERYKLARADYYDHVQRTMADSNRSHLVTEQDRRACRNYKESEHFNADKIAWEEYRRKNSSESKHDEKHTKDTAVDPSKKVRKTNKEFDGWEKKSIEDKRKILFDENGDIKPEYLSSDFTYVRADFAEQCERLRREDPDKLSAFDKTAYDKYKESKSYDEDRNKFDVYKEQVQRNKKNLNKKIDKNKGRK